jgi:ribosome-associated toxin RatA of RatAB toxin-antitoxin module
MHRVSRSAIVPHTPAVMYELVADVEAYPEFLPWCEGSEVRSRNDQELVASLSLGLAGLNSQFTTCNALDRPHAMGMRLVDGPFSQLEGNWQFDALGEGGCKVSLDIEFEFSSKLQDKLFGNVFESICNELIDAFVRRADQLHAN